MGRVMLGYRLYFLNDVGHIVDATEAELVSDDQAVEWAEQKRDEHDLELWSGARVVARIPRAPA